MIGRLGPYLTIPLVQRLSLTLEGGLAIGFLNSEYSWNERISAPALNLSIQRSGHSSNTEVLYGPFVGAELSYTLSKRWQITAGARWLDLGTSRETVGGRRAELRLQNLLMATLGATYSF